MVLKTASVVMPRPRRVITAPHRSGVLPFQDSDIRNAAAPRRGRGALRCGARRGVLILAAPAAPAAPAMSPHCYDSEKYRDVAATLSDGQLVRIDIDIDIDIDIIIIIIIIMTLLLLLIFLLLLLRKDKTSFWNYVCLQPVVDSRGDLKYYVGTQYTVLLLLLLLLFIIIIIIIIIDMARRSQGSTW